MKLVDLFKAVEDGKLDKQQLEQYHQQLSSLCAQMYVEAADLEKAEAIFFMEEKKESDIATKRAWKASDKGQRLTQLIAYIKATKTILNSLKSRMYNQY